MSRHGRGDWIQTYLGKKFYPLDPLVEDIDIRDIAHALSLICRFGGHCERFYSVAQHCCIVASHCGDDSLWGLLHDASEAYIGDLTRPLKCSLREAGQTFYADCEKRLMSTVCDKFGLAKTEPPIVKTMDCRALLTEKRDLLKDDLHWDAASSASWDVTPLCEFEDMIVPLSPEDAESEFLSMYEKLSQGMFNVERIAAVLL